LSRLPKIQGYAQNFWEGTAAVEHATGMFFGRLLLAYQELGNCVPGLLSRLPRIQGYAQNFWEGTAAVEHATGMFFGRLLLAYHMKKS
jgi:hypothetical protein